MTNLLANKKRAVHHWWPKSIQRHWKNENGQIYRRGKGIVEPKNPDNKRTGCARNSHFVDLGDSPWTHSFENSFNSVDAKGAKVVEKVIKGTRKTSIYRISRMKLTSWLPFSATATDYKCNLLSSDEIHSLARLVISIVIRSPAFQFRKSFLPPAFSSEKLIDSDLGKQNIWHHWADFFNDPRLPTDPISAVFMIGSQGKEFVIGDGFYEDFIDQRRFFESQSGAWDPRFKGAILFPLSPDICSLILLNSNLGQRLAALSSEQTAEINDITCINSRNEIYFRTQDQPCFQPHCEPNVRYVVLNEDSFLKFWLDAISSF